MPQVDLHPLFTPTTQQISITSSPDPSAEVVAAPQSPLPKRVRITGEQAVNAGFVIAACLGAVISAAFLFKGGEVFQEVAAWPRELFYGRPSPAPIATAANNSLGTNGTSLSSPDARDTGDPFSPTSKLLNLDPLPRLRPNSRPSGAPFSSPSNLDRLNMMSPRGDSFSRGLMQGTASSAAQTTSSAMGNAMAPSQTVAASGAQTSAVSKSAINAGTSKAISVKASNARRLSKVSARRSTLRKWAASAKHAFSNSSSSSKTSAKMQTPIGSAIPRSASPGVSQTSASLRSVGGMNQGIGSMHGAGAAGLGGGLGAAHSFGRAGGR